MGLVSGQSPMKPTGIAGSVSKWSPVCMPNLQRQSELPHRCRRPQPSSRKSYRPKDSVLTQISPLQETVIGYECGPQLSSGWSMEHSLAIMGQRAQAENRATSRCYLPIRLHLLFEVAKFLRKYIIWAEFRHNSYSLPSEESNRSVNPHGYGNRLAGFQPVLGAADCKWCVTIQLAAPQS